MREILFRGKTGNREWLEGYVMMHDHNKATMFRQHPGDGSLEGTMVDPETVCQFTGLTDKNGVKIWENDILQGNGNPKDLNAVVFGKLRVINIEPLGVVDDVIGWYYKPLETDALSKAIPFCLPMPLTEYYIKRCEFEVIGNIFDNPELMEGGAE
jgi:hypothetical protein